MRSMKKITITSAESLFIMGIINDQRFPENLPVNIQWLTIPVITNDPTLTDWKWEVKRPFMTRLRRGFIYSYDMSMFSYNGNTYSGYVISFSGKIIAYIRKIDIKFDKKSKTNYLTVEFEYDEYTFKSVMTRTMTNKDRKMLIEVGYYGKSGR